MEEPQALSQAAIDALKVELEELRTEGRRKMSERLLSARELGDISENSEYESAKQDQAFMEGRIAKLENLLKHSVVRSTLTEANSVVVGVVVTVRDPEADLEAGFLVADSVERVTGVRVLSPTSPLGTALLGRRVGDKVTYKAPGGTFTYEVVSLKPA